MQHANDLDGNPASVTISISHSLSFSLYGFTLYPSLPWWWPACLPASQCVRVWAYVRHRISFEAAAHMERLMGSLARRSHWSTNTREPQAGSHLVMRSPASQTVPYCPQPARIIHMFPSELDDRGPLWNGYHFPLFFCFCICVAQWGKKKNVSFLALSLVGKLKRLLQHLGRSFKHFPQMATVNIQPFRTGLRHLWARCSFIVSSSSSSLWPIRLLPQWMTLLLF